MSKQCSHVQKESDQQSTFVGQQSCVALQGAWRGRQNSKAVMYVVDNFFSATFSATLMHGCQPRDLDQPLHSDKTHKLLAENTTAINMSYTVY